MDVRTNTSAVEESAIIERVVRIVMSVRDAKPNYALLAAELEPAIPFDVFGVVLLRHDREAVRVAVCRREEGEWRVFPHQHPVKDSMLERVLASPMLMVNDYPEGQEGPPGETGDALSGHPQLRSTVIAPLVLEDQRVLGTLELGSSIPNTYVDETLQRLIGAVARVLAAAIERAQLGGSAAIFDRQRQALKDVTRALTLRIDLPTILNQIVEGIAKALNVSSAIIMLEQRDAALRLEAQVGLDATQFEENVRQKKLSDACILSQTLRQRTPHVSDDISRDERFPASCFFAEELGMHSILCYPLITGTTVLGALLLCSPEAGGFTPLKVEILSLFANQATFAIHNGMMLESAHQRSRFRQALEQFEFAYRQRQQDAYINNGHGEVQGAEEMALFERLREETERSYGVSLDSVLRFVGEFLLTNSELNLQAMIHAEQGLGMESRALSEAVTVSETSIALDEEMHSAERLKFSVEHEGQGEESDAMHWLTQAAEDALRGTGMLGELSPLIVRENGKDDAWLAVDLDGHCIFMNPAAQALCDMQLSGSMTALNAVYNAYNSYEQRLWLSRRQQPEVTTLESAFAKLMPRMRNVDEVRHYLHDFTQGTSETQELRCILAARPLPQEGGEKGGGNWGRARRELEGNSNDHHYHLTRHELRNRDGHLIAYVLQVRDVTEQARDEHNRSALLSSVSHDLRTPLTTIKAAVTGLLQEDLEWDETDRRILLQDIENETDHLTVQVNALVELSRIEMGALVLQRTWCDVVEVIYGALNKLTRIVEAHRVNVVIPEGMLMAYIDHVQLERVFYNLIENAARHSPRQSIITVQADNAGDFLRGAVIGYSKSGIPEEESERVFTAFYSSRTYGNGLSLAICKGIVEAHQGKIWVETVKEETSGEQGRLPEGGAHEGTGLSFVFTLPLHP
ncbi:hypothetical protein KSC_045660 [Ktedonobacter sp. SOSP1-52]|nr:hypothetical protein KSC_045660 [Ktedonobacter sp. SOSP1-52]